MNPIPLAAPNGTVYAYVCGVCRHIRANCSMMASHSDEDIASVAEMSRQQAERCCSCVHCGGLLRTYEPPVDDAPENRPFDCCPACWTGGEREKAEQRGREYQAQRARSDEIEAAALAKALDREAACALEAAMGDISEDCYCAGWSDGLEHVIWAAVLSGEPVSCGRGTITAEDIERLKALAAKAGGWWRWDEATDSHPFTPMAEWLALYEKERGA